MNNKNQLDSYKNGITVSYQGGKKIISYGDELTKQETATEPEISFEKTPGKLYTIMMVDPDAPSRKNPTNRHWLHLLIVNLSTKSKGDIINKYEGPSPPEGVHRYYVCVLEQKDEIKGLNEFPRLKFDVVGFTKDNDLKLLSCIKFTVKA